MLNDLRVRYHSWRAAKALMRYVSEEIEMKEAIEKMAYHLYKAMNAGRKRRFNKFNDIH